MLTGPYHTPLALAREPLMAFFWAVLAPVLFLTGAALMTLAAGPDAVSGTQQEVQAYQRLWLFTCLAMALWFGVMSVWSNWLGAGPFAGRMTASRPWILIAIMVGPILLIAPSLAVGALMSGSDWQYRGEVNSEIFTPRNWTLAYLFMAILMAPIVEEVAFRGVAMGALIARGISPAGAVILSSFVFAFSHLQYSFPAMAIVFISGIGFAILRLASGTVLVPLAAHISANATVLLLNWMAANPAT